MERIRGRIAKSSNPAIGNINLNPPSTKNAIKDKHPILSKLIALLKT